MTSKRLSLDDEAFVNQFIRVIQNKKVRQVIIGELFKDGNNDSTVLSERISALVNADGLCSHKKQKIKDALTALGL